MLAKRLGTTRPTLYKLSKSVNDKTFTKYKRIVSNNRICSKLRNKIFSETLNYLGSINVNRGEIIFLPTFRVPKPYIKSSNSISLKTFEEILKENNFYLPWCWRKTKKCINKRLKELKNPSKQLEIIEKFEEIKIERIYKKKMHIFGDTVEIDACVHPWFNDEKVHLYKTVDAGGGYVLQNELKKRKHQWATWFY